ncbi:MAG: hypothetical protein QMC89_03825 [Candidatus Hodarchaeaceae archaeon]|nr:hypothetical protein [Candidatus Hodarchaeaceae archaeon]
MGEKLAESLKLFLEKGKEWERRPTSVPGMFILKLPTYKRYPQRLCVEINPVDASGNPTKKRGLVVRNLLELKEFKNLLAEERLEKLMSSIDEINPPTAEKPKLKKKAEVIEI